MSVGYSEASARNGTVHPLEYPDIASVVSDIGVGLGRFWYGALLAANVLVLIATLLVFPVGAQIAVAVYLAQSVGWSWWDIVYILAVFSIVMNSIAFVL